MSETCKHHEAIQQCAHQAKKIAIDNEKKKVSWKFFTWTLGGLAAMGLILFYVATTQCSSVGVRVTENSRLVHRIDKNIAIIATHVGCEEKLAKGN